MMLSNMDGQGVKQFLELGAAFFLSALIGLEREIRHKSAGLRTVTVVGTSAALFMLISKHGFTDVLAEGRVVLDPSRVAAQIVTGIGFLGAGLIFLRADRVQGLTTAATVWLVTAVGMACAAGLILLALAVTLAYFVVALVFPRLQHLLPEPAPGKDQIKEPGRKKQ
ncbi:MAG: MgtC/SapB family protein [Bryobacterales bacterium]|nr:MgtC/SapB family protein [Bryobacterales bacterium]